MNIGSWVHTVHKGNKITGFITDLRKDTAEICVTIPLNYGFVENDLSELIKGDDTIWLDDIPHLIDFSLKIRDEGLFNKYIRELKKWKSISELDVRI